MLHTLNTTDLTPAQTRELRHWLGLHGVVAANVTNPCWVDPDLGSLIVDEVVAADGEEDADFPEHRVDEDGRVVTRREVVSLKVDPPRWVVAASQSRTAA